MRTRRCPIADGVSLEEAGALPLQGMTAHYLINDSYNVKPGDTVLTYAGAGGVGLLLIQLLKLRGATVITTTSTEEKAALARAAGADHVLAYDEVPDRVREITQGRGVEVVYDGIGKDTFENSLKSLKTRGTLVLFGGASGQVPPFDLQRLNAHGSLTVTRPKLADFLLDPEERRWRSGRAFRPGCAGQASRPDRRQLPALRGRSGAHRPRIPGNHRKGDPGSLTPPNHGPPRAADGPSDPRVEEAGRRAGAGGLATACWYYKQIPTFECPLCVQEHHSNNKFALSS